MKKWIPSGPDMVREGIVAAAGMLIAAFIISRIPAVRQFVQQNSLTVQDNSGNVLY